MQINQKEFIQNELTQLQRTRKLFQEMMDEEGVVVFFGDNTYLGFDGMVKRQTLAFVPQIFKEIPEIKFNVFCRDPFTGGIAIASPSFIPVRIWAECEVSVVDGKIEYMNEILKMMKEVNNQETM